MAKPLVQTVGRRKASVVRVRFNDGTGLMSLNGRTLEDYFPGMAQRLRVLEPIRITGAEGRYDVSATLEGGGLTGQSDALRLGIARALVALDPELRATLKKAGSQMVTVTDTLETRTAKISPVSGIFILNAARPLTTFCISSRVLLTVPSPLTSIPM